KGVKKRWRLFACVSARWGHTTVYGGLLLHGEPCMSCLLAPVGIMFFGTACAVLFAPAAAGADQLRPSAQAQLARYGALIKPSHRKHWSFRPVRRPAVPRVRATGWLRNPIDAFILSGLEKKGWKPSPAAPPRAILRRVYFDLIGLPPTPAEQAAFLQNP